MKSVDSVFLVRRAALCIQPYAPCHSKAAAITFPALEMLSRCRCRRYFLDPLAFTHTIAPSMQSCRYRRRRGQFPRDRGGRLLAESHRGPLRHQTRQLLRSFCLCLPDRRPRSPRYKIGDYVPKTYRKATKVMARDIELAVIAADDCFKSSGLQSKAYTENPTFDVSRFGCNIGAGLISAELNELAPPSMSPAMAPLWI